MSVMACVSACEELVHGPVQTVDGCGEPSALFRAILVTAPNLRDGVCEVHGAFRAQPARRVCAIAIRHENAPCWIRTGRVDGENEGE